MGHRILIVDDSVVMRKMIAKVIRIAGIPCGEVHFARHGREALEVMDANELDLVISDVNMPEMDGIAMMRTIAGRDAPPKVPVVMVSTEGSDERIAELRRYGIRGYLRKPVTPEELTLVIEKILGANDDDRNN